jgi:hypothetical protein
MLVATNEIKQDSEHMLVATVRPWVAIDDPEATAASCRLRQHLLRELERETGLAEDV